MSEQLGRYEILEEIGQGGFAIVYRGRDTALDRQVALKELRPILLQDTEWVKRFRREARTIARLDHPHIVPIYDVYEVENRLFIVMRLVDGSSLEELIAARGGLPWPEVVATFEAVTDGLNHAHSQGILHRDLKPANILIDPQRGPMLSDFGLAKLAGESSMGTTAAGGVVGTPQYIPPEVWEGQGTTARSDIYALGCILSETLTGDKVFKGDTPPAVMLAHFRAPNLPQVWPANVPADVRGVLLKALAQEPTERYESAADMYAALSALETGQAQQVQSPGIEPATTIVSASEAEPYVDHPPAAAALDEAEQAAAETPIVTSVSPTNLRQESEYGTTPRQPREDAVPAAVAPARPQSEEKLVAAGDPYPGDRQPRKARPRRGCFWVGLAGVIAFLILVVAGVGTFCSTAGNSLNSAFATVETGETMTEEIRVPVPDSSQIAELVVDFGFGTLNIEPGADEVLVDGTAKYNVEQLRPQVVSHNNEVRVQAETGIGLGGFTSSNITNEWDLKLAAVPMKLTITGGGARSKIELGGLSLQDLVVHFGGADLDLSFTEPNLVEMDKLEISGGASNASLTGLANSRADDIIFQGGAGSFTLDFSGELQDDLDVKIEAGLGAIVVIVPDDVSAQVSVDGVLANVTTDGPWLEAGQGVYRLGDIDLGNQIKIDIEMGPGSLELRAP